jgi:2-polyprenyl-3-methyl-5-hydroxy-6-metoxy-1,4-benzoquinol methylase
MQNKYSLDVSKYSTHRVIGRLLDKNKTILDVGCNDGYLANVSDVSNNFYGIDNLESSVKNARKQYQDAAVVDLNENNSVPWKKKFDVIVFADVLEHLVDPGTTLSIFSNKYLKKDGCVIISLPNIANWQIRLKLLLGSFDYEEVGILDRTHLHFYTFRSAKIFIENSGLKIQKEQYGSSVFGGFLSLFSCFKTLLATSIIIVAKNS